MSVRARERLMLALDFPLDRAQPDRLIEPADAHRLLDELGDLVDVVKVGWPLYLTGGLDLVRELRDRGKRVFLDLKFGDISETVRRLVSVAVREQVAFLTIHSSFQAVRAAVEARAGSDLQVLTITLLTSLGPEDLREMGIDRSVEEHVLHMARGAVAAGSDGIVASGREVARIRAAVGDALRIVTPGVRPSGVSRDDHQRAVTPAAAIEAGSDYLVVGRPVLKAASPRDALLGILDEMQRAFDRCRA